MSAASIVEFVNDVDDLVEHVIEAIDDAKSQNISALVQDVAEIVSDAESVCQDVKELVAAKPSWFCVIM
jgi:hypothetical protein